MTDADYDALLFDFDGVLLGTGNGEFGHLIDRSIDKALQDYGITEDAPHYGEFSAALRNKELDRLQELGDAYHVDAADLWQTKEFYAVQEQKHQIQRGERAFYEDVAVFPDLAETYDLGIVSNNNHDFIQYMATHESAAAAVLDGNPLETYVDAVYGIPDDIDAVGNRKPDPTYINRAIKDLDAENPVYIGDKETDILAAENAGIDAMFVPSTRDPADVESTITAFDGTDPETVTAITSLEDLLEV